MCVYIYIYIYIYISVYIYIYIYTYTYIIIINNIISIIIIILNNVLINVKTYYGMIWYTKLLPAVGSMGGFVLHKWIARHTKLRLAKPLTQN